MAVPSSREIIGTLLMETRNCTRKKCCRPSPVPARYMHCLKRRDQQNNMMCIATSPQSPSISLRLPPVAFPPSLQGPPIYLSLSLSLSQSSVSSLLLSQSLLIYCVPMIPLSLSLSHTSVTSSLSIFTSLLCPLYISLPLSPSLSLSLSLSL